MAIALHSQLYRVTWGSFQRNCLIPHVTSFFHWSSTSRLHCFSSIGSSLVQPRLNYIKVTRKCSRFWSRQKLPWSIVPRTSHLDPGPGAKRELMGTRFNNTRVFNSEQVNELNTRREIPYTQATMQYFVYHRHLTYKKATLFTFQKRKRYHSWWVTCRKVFGNLKQTWEIVTSHLWKYCSSQGWKSL